MKKILLAALSFLLILAAGCAPKAADNAPQFVHTAAEANIDSNWTYLDHPLLNGDPSALALVTQNYNPGGTGETYNDHSIGVWYDEAVQKWAVYNQDLAAMPVGGSFNVLIPGSAAFVHQVTSANAVVNGTIVDNPLVNGKPDAILIVTANYNPGNMGFIYNDSPLGLWYDSAAQRWQIFNQNTSFMPAGAAFNVWVAPAGASAYVHQTTPENISNNWSYFDHPLLNGKPDAIILTIQQFTGNGDAYNDHDIGVWFHIGAGKWAVFNQDLADMPSGLSFNVVIAGE